MSALLQAWGEGMVVLLMVFATGLALAAVAELLRRLWRAFARATGGEP